MGKLLIFVAGGVIGYFTKTVLGEMEKPLIFNPLGGQEFKKTPFDVKEAKEKMETAGDTAGL